MTMHQSAQIASRIGASSPPPIGRWVEGLNASQEEGVEQLRAAYRQNRPTQGELIFTGACEFACAHCIYPPEFARANRTMPVDAWREVIRRCEHDLQFGTYVYGGRSLPASGLEMLEAIRELAPRAKLGMIDNGISLTPLRDRLAGLELDWIDISLDGLEADHDRQRGRAGSFRAGLEGALWLVRNGIAPKVNILTCLTTLNKNSIVPMIRTLNAIGLKNFFITPVTVVEGMRPSTDLRLSASDFSKFVAELRASLASLDDAWVEINFFAAEYAEYLARLLPEIWNGFAFNRDSLSWYEAGKETANGTTSELRITYYPSSLTGTREFIVNTNGDVIVPKSMAAGKVTADHIIGNLLREGALEIVKSLPESPQFEFYCNEFLDEQKLLGRYLYERS